MAERRVANIVRQTAGLNNIADVRWFQPGGQIAGGLQRITHTHSQGTPYAGDFQAVSEAVVHMIVGGQRVNLCLASQATKRARENDVVVIRIKRRSALFTFGGPTAQTLGAQKLFPIHRHGHASPVMTQYTKAHSTAIGVAKSLSCSARHCRDAHLMARVSPPQTYPNRGITPRQLSNGINRLLATSLYATLAALCGS